MLKVEKKSKETTIRLEAKTASVCKTRVPRRTSSLDRGNDWKLRVDLDMKLVFPTIWETNLIKTRRNVSLQAFEDAGPSGTGRATARAL